MNQKRDKSADQHSKMTLRTVGLTVPTSRKPAACNISYVAFVGIILRAHQTIQNYKYILHLLDNFDF